MSKSIKHSKTMHEEDWDGFYHSDEVSTKRKYGVSHTKFMLLKAWYDAQNENLKEDKDFYDDDGVFHPAITLEEFIKHNGNCSERKLNTIVYSY